MKKRMILFVVCGILLGGCFSGTDHEAVLAAERYRQAKLPSPETLDLQGALNLAGREKYPAVRRHFAGLKFAGARRDIYEQHRVSLNGLLGYLPENMIVYRTEGAWDCPEEIPPVADAEKAALILDGGRTPVVDLLVKVRRSHAQAVYHLNRMQLDKTGDAAYFYFISSLELAGMIGVDLPELSGLRSYVSRFDAAEIRMEKTEKNAEND